MFPCHRENLVTDLLLQGGLKVGPSRTPFHTPAGLRLMVIHGNSIETFLDWGSLTAEGVLLVIGVHLVLSGQVFLPHGLSLEFQGRRGVWTFINWTQLWSVLHFCIFGSVFAFLIAKEYALVCHPHYVTNSALPWQNFPFSSSNSWTCKLSDAVRVW